MNQNIKKNGPEGTTRKKWEYILKQWKISELSQRAFCEAHHVKPSSFSYWVNKFKNQPEPNLVGAGAQFAQINKATIGARDSLTETWVKPITQGTRLSLAICGMELGFSDKLEPDRLQAYLTVLRGL